MQNTATAAALSYIIVKYTNNDAAVTKEVERLQQITNQADVEKYMKKKAEE